MEETKEVHYWFYCPTCKHFEKNETDEPCDECLAQGWNIDSHKPIRYEKKN